MIATSGRALAIAAMAIGVALAASGDEWKARDWPQADKLFHTDKRWLGADAAFSVPLGGDRVLWLLGDTFIGDGKVTRAKSAFIRNSIAVQHGLDPSRAKMSFYWRTTAGKPGSYFDGDGETWLWPLHGLVRNGALTIFFMRIAPTNEGMGFKTIGTAALRCDRLTDNAGEWNFRPLTIGEPPAGLDLSDGVAVLEASGYVLAYCALAPGNHDAYLARWRAEDFDRGDLALPEWWDGAKYVLQRELHGAPAVVLPYAATEFSVHRTSDGRYLQVQSLGFGATDIGLRFAPRPEGPWSKPEAVYRPHESRERGAFVYAAKAHPELEGEPLIVTYAANHKDPQKLLRSRSLYYPRFVQLQPKTSRRP